MVRWRWYKLYTFLRANLSKFIIQGTNLITNLVFPDYRRRMAAALMPQRSDGNFYRRRSSGDAVYYSCIIISHSNTDHNGFATSQVISVIRCIRFARNFAYHYSMIMRPLCALHSRLNVATSTSWRWFWWWCCFAFHFTKLTQITVAHDSAEKLRKLSKEFNYLIIIIALMLQHCCCHAC